MLSRSGVHTTIATNTPIPGMTPVTVPATIPNKTAISCSIFNFTTIYIKMLVENSTYDPAQAFKTWKSEILPTSPMWWRCLTTYL